MIEVIYNIELCSLDEMWEQNDKWKSRFDSYKAQQKKNLNDITQRGMFILFPLALRLFVNLIPRGVGTRHKIIS